MSQAIDITEAQFKLLQASMIVEYVQGEDKAETPHEDLVKKGLFNCSYIVAGGRYYNITRQGREVMEAFQLDTAKQETKI